MADLFDAAVPASSNGDESGETRQHWNPISHLKGVYSPEEIALAERLALKIRTGKAVRTDIVEQIKAEIAAGEYETPERIEATVDQLMAEVFPYTCGQ